MKGLQMFILIESSSNELFLLKYHNYCTAGAVSGIWK